MNRVAIFILVLFSLLVFAPDCAKVREKAEAMKPEIREIVLKWGEVTSATTEVIATIRVYNPNPISLPVKKIAFDITMNNIKMARAETIDLHIKKEAEFPIKVSAKIDNAKIPDFWAKHLRQNERSEVLIDMSTTFNLVIKDFTFPFRLKLPIKTDLLAKLKKAGPIPIAKTVKLPIVGEKTVFKITLRSLSGKWGTVTPDSTEVNLLASIHNENPYPLVVPKIAYEVDMNGIPLASGETRVNYYFAPDSIKDISITLTLKTSLMDKWFVTHIQGGEKSTFNIQTSLVFELPREIAKQLGQDRIIVPVWEGIEEFETDILGTKK